MKQQPSVSVVIPTVVRPSLEIAIRSVRAQTYHGSVEIVVVVDCRSESVSSEQWRLLRSIADVIVPTGGGLRAAKARNVGVQASGGELIAFLDDDDTWLPRKLEWQVPQLFRNGGLDPKRIIASRAHERHASGGPLSCPIPTRLITENQKVEDFLFRRRRPGLTRASLFTSCLLTSREMALASPWDGNLRRHQDWDWLISSQKRHQATIEQIPQPAIVYTLGSTDSISARPDWQNSLAWANSWRAEWSASTYCDFVTGQPLRYAVQARSWSGAVSSVRAASQAGRLPAFGPLALGIGAIVPRHKLEGLAIRASSPKVRAKPDSTAFAGG